ncbi:uncharacterized protein LOC108628009, partial [Ceratina calcarata]|uniref:Uncharacterized protein LOC108628009 n=1 Tax=Ceratina calcarata TaxID=156304 RepID=A0AAJ7WD98_9HYME
VTTPVCGITGAQQLGKSGWSELRNLSDTEPPFRLFRDEGRTFLQWIGETGLREAAEGRVVMAKLVCRDASPKSKFPGVFTPCVAFRVAGSPSKSNVREVIFSSTTQLSQGLSATEYTAIGLSSVILALIYVASVSLYLHKSYHCIDNKFRITSAIVHPNCTYMEQSEGCFGSGSILGERIPEEDVRVVETADNTHQQDVPVLPGTQRRKLYFNPAYFDRQLLLAPPPAAIEFLLKIREVISIAKHKMAMKRFVPTLGGITEEESICESAGKNHQQQSGSSVQGSKSRKSQRCTGCPGCTDSFRNTPSLPDQPSPGESKVRAWLEDVRTAPQRRWRDAEEARRTLQENTRTFNRNLEYLKALARRELDVEKMNPWKDKQVVKAFENVARSEIIETDDRHSVSKRSTKSMFEETNYCLSRNGDSSVPNGDEAINAKVRKAIENSFIKQMEENASLQKNVTTNKEKNVVPKNEDEKVKTNCSNSMKRKKELPDMINELPNTKNTAKRIMDAVIREMVDAKVLDSRSGNIADYEVDSLERSKSSRKSSTSPEFTDQSSPALSTALPMDEELTMQNAVIDTKTGQMMTSNKLDKDVIEKNYYNSLPELISQKPEGYSLVSEVYVNDGYDSPACSDDSGPDIRYEPENPGHLTIKVQDSPENYVKQDESEYEPDTLDRKPMKLRINDDVHYERDVPDEVYVDSLERPAQILLKSKGSFRDQDSTRNAPSLQRGYGSLREIYEARLKSTSRDLSTSTRSLNAHSESSMSWKKCKYLTPETRQLKRQRQPSNRPDVVPLPPTENIYQHPKPPRLVKDGKKVSCLSKNGWGRSPAGAGDPTTSNGAPVPKEDPDVGTNDCSCKKPAPRSSESRNNSKSKSNSSATWNYRSQKDSRKTSEQESCRSHSESEICKKHPGKSDRNQFGYPPRKVEDSGYLSSTDSNGSHKQLLKHEVSSVSETDETESVCDGASESGAESVGTDSVFFGNFRRLSDVSFSKSMDSGVEIAARGCTYFQPFCPNGFSERTNFSNSDSETESFITVLPPCRDRDQV